MRKALDTEQRFWQQSDAEHLKMWKELWKNWFMWWKLWSREAELVEKYEGTVSEI